METESKKLTHGFTPLFDWVMDNPELSNSEAQIVCRVLRGCEGGCFESNATIGRQLKMDPRTVRRLIKKLSLKEWLTVHYPDKYHRTISVDPKRLVTWREKLLTARRRWAKQEASGKARDTETEGNATLKSKIKDFLWTLYEKTLKVIVDAVMERIWPK
ncbi:MAG: hypothetical protein WAK60_09670 [Sedimentisphaerales bacterium]